MPIYGFLCRKSKTPFEGVYSLEEYERETKKKIKCPKCETTSVVRQLSAVEVKTSKKS